MQLCYSVICFLENVFFFFLSLRVIALHRNHIDVWTRPIITMQQGDWRELQVFNTNYTDRVLSLQLCFGTLLLCRNLELKMALNKVKALRSSTLLSPRAENKAQRTCVLWHSLAAKVRSPCVILTVCGIHGELGWTTEGEIVKKTQTQKAVKTHYQYNTGGIWSNDEDFLHPYMWPMYNAHMESIWQVLYRS